MLPHLQICRITRWGSQDDNLELWAAAAPDCQLHPGRTGSHLPRWAL